MSDKKWTAWFLLSCLWFLVHAFVTMVASDIQELGRNWFFLSGYIISAMNLLFCIYIGSIPSESN